AALVSGDAEKRAQLGQKYGVDAIGYEELAALLESKEVDAIYIATPNTRHAAYALLAAERAIHALVANPLPPTHPDSPQTIAATPGPSSWSRTGFTSSPATCRSST